jgi:hypothetical protein
MRTPLRIIKQLQVVGGSCSADACIGEVDAPTELKC